MADVANTESNLGASASRPAKRSAVVLWDMENIQPPLGKASETVSALKAWLRDTDAWHDAGVEAWIAAFFNLFDAILRDADHSESLCQALQKEGVEQVEAASSKLGVSRLVARLRREASILQPESTTLVLISADLDALESLGVLKQSGFNCVAVTPPGASDAQHEVIKRAAISSEAWETVQQRGLQLLQTRPKVQVPAQTQLEEANSSEGFTATSMMQSLAKKKKSIRMPKGFNLKLNLNLSMNAPVPGRSAKILKLDPTRQWGYLKMVDTREQIYFHRDDILMFPTGGRLREGQLVVSFDPMENEDPQTIQHGKLRAVNIRFATKTTESSTAAAPASSPPLVDEPMAASRSVIAGNREAGETEGRAGAGAPADENGGAETPLQTPSGKKGKKGKKKREITPSKPSPKPALVTV